jgi:uncharacterized protein
MAIPRLVKEKLLSWKGKEKRKPLILQGVRQCGKTWILKEFGTQEYADTAYFNFEENPQTAKLFEKDHDPHRILMELGVLLGRKLRPKETLIVFDEVQFSPNTLTALKYFQEKTPEYHIICAGSLLGVTLAGAKSFPVGKVEFLTLYPLNFKEFLLANGESELIGYLEEADGKKAIPEVFVSKLQTLLTTFYITGGMPEVVASWIEMKDITAVEAVQDAIIKAYYLDFARHAPPTDFPKISRIWESIPGQLAKENRKFMYSGVKKGARAKDLEPALQWLTGAGMAHQVRRIEKPAIPLSAYADEGFFKLYLSDTGLLRRMAQVPASALLQTSLLFQEFKGALVENYVLTELVALHDQTPWYWKSGNTAEVDFIIPADDRIIPLEVKSSWNVKSRSLGVYRSKYSPPLSVRVSLRNLRMDASLLNIPLYLLRNFDRLVEKH